MSPETFPDQKRIPSRICVAEFEVNKVDSPYRSSLTQYNLIASRHVRECFGMTNSSQAEMR